MNTLYHGDMLTVLPTLPRVDLIVTSPPYEDARTYGIGFRAKGAEWVTWAADRFMLCLDRCDGLVAWVVAGRTRGYQWSATPALLMAELHRRGAVLRNPLIYKRVGIPGSGGPDWFRSDYEWIVCATKRARRLDWADNTAMGHAPKYPAGGAPSHRTESGERVTKVQTRRKENGVRVRDGLYKAPAVANPGNVIQCHGGGGHMGSKLAHENEAPFPERVPEWFIRSCCIPGGLVLDPFCGSGTTLAVAKRLGRRFIGIDVRESQIELSRKRLAEVKP